MNVLVVGDGSREKALVWHLENSPLVQNVVISPSDISEETVQELAKGMDLAIIGPEQALADGLADALRAVCTPVFGPNVQAAKLESSKVYARNFMKRNNVSCPRHRHFESYSKIPKLKNTNVVVKADGLARGKGVWLCETQEDIEETVAKARKIGEGSYLIEERIYGREYSFCAITDGTKVIELPPCTDYKREFEEDVGENTGGMGAICPAPDFPRDQVLKDIVYPTMKGIKNENIFYRGVIYFGIIVDDFGKVHCLEYNVRFGDPETQALVRAIGVDLTSFLVAAAKGDLPSGPHIQAKQPAACVVLASKDYPRAPIKDKPITGLVDAACIDDVVLFEGAMRTVGDNKIYHGSQTPIVNYLTNGGRVLSVTAKGKTLKAACETAYKGVDEIDFVGKKYRKDIGK